MGSLQRALIFVGNEMFNKAVIFILLSHLQNTPVSCSNNYTEKSRVGKFLNFFHVIRFSNEGCTGAGGLNGTCYTPEECRDRSGAATSSCAGGFGVCCIFGLSCGGTSSEN